MGKMTPEPISADWPPFPSVSMGKGQWVKVIRALERAGTVDSHRLSVSIRKSIDQDVVERERMRRLSGRLFTGTVRQIEGQDD